MTVNEQKRLDLTRDKLRLLEKTYAEAELDYTGTSDTRELTLRSLKGLINQLKEEIARFATHAVTPTSIWITSTSSIRTRRVHPPP